jgi:hypothetical protein
MNPTPVETFEQSTELGGGQAHHPVADAGPAKPALLELPFDKLRTCLAIRHSPVPSHQISLTRSAFFARKQ